MMVAWLAAAGCMLDLSSVGPRCEDSTDCQAGWNCNAGICQPPPFQSIVDFELIPEIGSGSAATQVAGVDLAKEDRESRLEIVLNKAVPFSGAVTSPVGVSGSLLASREPEFDGRGLTWNFQVGSDGYFEAPLAFKAEDPEQGPDPLNTYQAMFRPSNREDFPQLRYTGLRVTEAGLNQEIRYPDYPPPEQLDQQVELLLVRVRVLQSEGYPHPVTGIQVEGTTETGLRTNLATPDSQGVAYLRLPVIQQILPEPTRLLPAALSLTIKPADNTIRLPTARIPDLQLGQPDLGTFYLGDLPVSHIVTGVVVTASGQPVPGCQLRFQADGIGNGSFEKALQADEGGEFSTTLPAGNYSVMAVPDLLSGAALTSKQIEVGPDMQPETIELGARLRIAGRVFDPDGGTVADVTILAERTSDWFGQDDGALRTFEGASDSDGRFELLVDPGTFDLALIPPPASGLPRLRHADIRIFDQDKDLSRGATTLPRPELIEGHTFGHAGSTACGVSVDVYRSDADSATLLGQAVSGTDDGGGCNGKYSLVVPASQ
jgi:hypothetical protein